LKERHDLRREALEDSLEDVAMLRAIQAGEKSPLTSRKRIFQRLSGKALSNLDENVPSPARRLTSQPGNPRLLP